MRKPQPAPLPAPEIDEYAEVKIPFDDVLRKLVNTPAAAKSKAVVKKLPAPKKG